MTLVTKIVARNAITSKSPAWNGCVCCNVSGFFHMDFNLLDRAEFSEAVVSVRQ